MSKFPEVPSILADIEYQYEKIEFSTFKSMVYKGAETQLNELNDSVLDRISEELAQIEKSELKDYFLLWKSIIDFCNTNQICRGPGRGVINCSLVAKCLGFTQVNALEWNLPYQRFLNITSGVLPSFSLDVSLENRDLIVQYLKKLFGNSHIGALAGRDDEEIISTEVAKYFSSAGSGIVISANDLKPTVPTFKLKDNSNELIVDFPIKYLQNLGCIKFDIFGLKQLESLQKIYTKNEEKIYPDSWDDPKVFEYILSTKSQDIFPFHLNNTRRFMLEFETNTIESLALAYALSRPSLMNYIDGMKAIYKEEKDLFFLHESLHEPLKSTYGYIVYKEQFLEIIVRMSGFGYDFADMMYRYLLEDDLQNHTLQFIDQCEANGIEMNVIQQVMSELIASQPFLFSKSHAIGAIMMGYTEIWHKIYSKN